MNIFPILLALMLAAPMTAVHHRDAAALKPAPLTAAGNPVIKRGAALGTSPVVKLSAVLANPASYANKSIILEGKVRECCQRKGCWMELTAAGASAPIRVTFKDYGFFVPIRSKGYRARAEGTVVVKRLSKEEVEHMRSEGASMKPEPDGTVLEVGFVANGVELRK